MLDIALSRIHSEVYVYASPTPVTTADLSASRRVTRASLVRVGKLRERRESKHAGETSPRLFGDARAIRKTGGLRVTETDGTSAAAGRRIAIAI